MLVGSFGLTFAMIQTVPCSQRFQSFSAGDGTELCAPAYVAGKAEKRKKKKKKKQKGQGTDENGSDPVAAVSEEKTIHQMAFESVCKAASERARQQLRIRRVHTVELAGTMARQRLVAALEELSEETYRALLSATAHHFANSCSSNGTRE